MGDVNKWLFKTQDGLEIFIECGVVYPVKKIPISDTIKSSSDDGYVITRPRNTRRRYNFEFSLPYILLEDGKKLEDLDLTVTGTEWFYWYNLLEDKEYKVRFQSGNRPTFTWENNIHVTVELALEEV